MVADRVRRVVIDLRKLIDTRRHLPHLAPELLVLQFLERRIDVTTDADAMRHRAPAWRPFRCATSGLRRDLGTRFVRYGAHRNFPQ